MSNAWKVVQMLDAWSFDSRIQEIGADKVIKEAATEIERLRAALLLARVAVSHACELSDRILYTQDLVRIDAALGEKE
jgi:hypothetical protein